jgi:hypothetical protein
MKLLISRTYNKTETLSSLFILSGQEVKYKAKTIELPDNGNQHNVSCIPEGTYDTIKENNPKHGNCFRVLNVPGRDGILIHKGNYSSAIGKSDTKGCILPGDCFYDINQDGNIDIINSTKTLDDLLAILPDKFKLIII